MDKNELAKQIKEAADEIFAQKQEEEQPESEEEEEEK